jgi:hypothetical protein
MTPVSTRQAATVIGAEGAPMSEIVEGQRYWKRGDHRHVWIVDAVLQRKDGDGHFAIMVAEHGEGEEEVDLDRLRDRSIYTCIPDDPHRVPEE